MIHQEAIELRTTGHRDIHDITGRVAEITTASGIGTGVAHVFNVGSTGCVGTIEFEPGLERDLPEMLDRLMPPSRDYGHEQAWHDLATDLPPGMRREAPIANDRGDHTRGVGAAHGSHRLTRMVLGWKRP
jgi:thiamine phosphate synthase YjbQ (UPF0047 family)